MRNPLVLGHGAHVVRRHHAGVVGTVGEDDDHLASRHLGGIAQRQQQRVVERRIVARDALAQSGDGVGVIVGQRGGARQIAAEGVDRDRIGAVQAAHEIGDGVLRVHEALVHEVAGVEEHEDVGADEGVGAFHAGQRVLVGFQQRAWWRRPRPPPAAPWRLRRRWRSVAECRLRRSGNRWASGR